MKRRLLETFLVVAALITNVQGDEPKPAAAAVKPDFELLEVTFEPIGLSSFGQTEQLRILTTGQCWYQADGLAATANVSARNGGRFAHPLSADRIRRLNSLLKETQWLTADGAEGRATHLHAATIKLSLKRDGKTRSVVCEGRRPEPYQALLHELQGIAIQERRIYLHDYVSGNAGADAWREVGLELDALLGKPYAKSPYHIEYERYLAIATRNLRDFYNKPDDELIPSVRLVGYLKQSSELKSLHLMAHDRSPHLRKEVAWALGRIHNDESLPVLISMMSAGGTRWDVGFELIQWGNDAVPAIVKLVGQSTQDDLNEQERTTGEDMIRAYLEHWNKLDRPINAEVIASVQKALAAKNPRNGFVRTTYHTEFLNRIASK